MTINFHTPSSDDASRKKMSCIRSDGPKCNFNGDKTGNYSTGGLGDEIQYNTVGKEIPHGLSQILNLFSHSPAVSSSGYDTVDIDIVHHTMDIDTI